MKRAFETVRKLVRNCSGAAMTELALSLPIVTTIGLWGTELANFALVNMKVHALAVHLADNASRVGDTSNLLNRKIYESDINDLLLGSSIQAGSSLKFYDRGRAIISSLETQETPSGSAPQQYIHWQRCKGVKNWSSHYGNEGANVTGMGPSGKQVTAPAGEAVIFVEVAYDYQPLISSRFIRSTTITSIASFSVRDKRDLTQIYQQSPSATVSACNVYNSFPAVTV